MVVHYCLAIVMTKYFTVIGNSPSNLDEKVNALMGTGWMPQGGVAVGIPYGISVGISANVLITESENNLIFCQAMVLTT